MSFNAESVVCFAQAYMDAYTIGLSREYTRPDQMALTCWFWCRVCMIERGRVLWSPNVGWRSSNLSALVVNRSSAFWLSTLWSCFSNWPLMLSSKYVATVVKWSQLPWSTGCWLVVQSLHDHWQSKTIAENNAKFEWHIDRSKFVLLKLILLGILQ